MGHHEAASEDAREMQNGFIATAERRVPGQLLHDAEMTVMGEEELQEVHQKQGIRTTLLLPL